MAKRNLTDGVKFELVLEKKETLLEKGKEKQIRKPVNSVLSLNDKTESHNTQKEIAKDLSWSTGKVAKAGGDKVSTKAVMSLNDISGQPHNTRNEIAKRVCH